MSEEDSKIKFRFKPDALKDWKNLAVQSYTFSNELVKECLCEDMRVSEVVLHELYKLSVNSVIFREFLDELEEVVEVDKDGALDLTEEEIGNIWKCLLSLTESKKLLKDASLSLETH